MQFQKAVKRDAKLRLALSGPAGSGKTYSLLSLATELGGPIAYVDTEHGSASKYADLFTFDVIEPEEFDPRKLIETIQAAVDGGYRVICIDSLSHYWMGKGGELEMVDAAAKRVQGNSFAAWKHVTPVHNQLVDTIISAQIHVLVSMRTKTEWVVEKDERTGKNAPRKVGLQPVMRDGIEFEFDVCGDLDQDNTLTVTKSRCPELTGKAIPRPGKDMAQTLKRWLTAAPQHDKPPAPPEVIAPKAPAAAETVGSANGSNGTGGAPTTREIPPTTAAAPVPAEVEALWKRMGNSRQGIVDVLSDLAADLIEVAGAQKGQAEYKRIETQFAGGEGMAIQKVGFARRVVLELWRRIQAYKTQANPDVDDSDIPAEIGSPRQGELIEMPKEPMYAD
jgi:AAA domain